ncbi:sensor domain-containing diguanylate cyclase [Clostridium sporogenes]|uniref:Sensor domain-containing diguanylate cyclase n=1 Tax=Clostridium botulinum TaxID=1491 RepID=A0A6M0SYN6_CLOBO|nr:sensor domain-containing diguanylate cyclase [Clostridium sporogenes]NFA60619.1 sensor domain-containing diguanylate cyclase [Clostridium botulinum]NFI74211.1 sensor domain-containing diguanylate cyclase [Clostridium sporogenes]NFL72285.1 sensor domain-containing diguanylate cyclase [Clostridium sporogenes]NFM25359.1 sensor domain-containing diguanylate cyclase [Clostridium sporogenes]NFP62085.1 sensor domain-containing diguanylate cyclase [Clostridium sporogenes]
MLYVFIIILFLVMIIYQNITIIKLKNNIKKLEYSKNKIYHMTKDVSKQKNIDKIYETILQTAIDLIPKATQGSILIMDEKQEFNYVAIIGYDNKLKNIKLNKKEVCLYRINRFKETAIIENPLKLDEKILDEEKINEFKELQALNISCIISAPIYIDNKLFGQINIDCIKENYIFKQEDLELMDYIKDELQLIIKSFMVKEELIHKANYDELTKIFNRRYFNEIMRNETKGSNKTLVLIDIDNFKTINDIYGHNTGDFILKAFANLIKRYLRDKDLFFRFGGDEFIVLFNNLDDKSVINFMENIRRKVNNNKIKGINIDFSYGISKLENYKLGNYDEIINLADKNMYINKNKKIIV